MAHNFDTPETPVSLEEVITLPKYDPNNITLEKMKNLQASLSHKKKKGKLRREFKKK